MWKWAPAAIALAALLAPSGDGAPVRGGAAFADDDPPTVRLENLYPGVAFDRPVAAVQPPDGTDRLFVVEHPGRVFVLPYGGAAPTEPAAAKHLALDLTDRVVTDWEEGLQHLAFHPDFAVNGRLFLTYTRQPDRALQLSEFRVSGDDPDGIDPASERELLVVPQPEPIHSGGALEFGPDGMLYVALGDGGRRVMARDLASLAGSILRIDVDTPAGSAPYAVPPDNPFVDRPGARPEIWAYGFRHPWRMRFDPVTGDLWAADVGSQQFEEVDLVEPGGDHGWSRFEGFDDHRPWEPEEPNPLVWPVAVYSHEEGRAVIGGSVYRGAAIPGLVGRYVFGDHESRRLWTLSTDGSAERRLLLASDQILTGIDPDRAGELLVCSYQGGGRVLKLVPDDTPAPDVDALPPTLSETGLFRSLPRRRPVKRARRYSVQAELWADHAWKERFVVLPRDTAMTRRDDGTFELPPGGRVVKTFTLGRSRARRRPLETRVIVRTDDGYQMGTYRWDPDGRDARLLHEREFAVVEGPAGLQTWTFPGPSDCVSCHNGTAGPLLGLSDRQLRGSRRHPGRKLRRWARRGLLAGDVPRARDVHRNVALDSDAPLDRRVRSYLDVNCSHCHRRDTGVSVGLDLRADAALPDAGVGRHPARGSFGLDAARVLKPGEPQHSTLLEWVRRRGDIQMPRLGSNVVHHEAVELLEAWIESLDPAEDP